MKAGSMLNLVKKFIRQYGVPVTYQKMVETVNSRGVKIWTTTDEVEVTIVLLLKEKFNPLQFESSGAIGIGQDYTRYVIALPDVDIKKDMVITDNHNQKWKLGIIDWFDVGGVPVAKQAAVTEVL